MGYRCTSLCGSGRCSDCCGELVANLCGGTSWWLGGWWEGGRKEKERHEQEQEVKEEEQDQQDQEDKDAESRPQGAVERAHSAWGQAVGVRPHPRTTRRAVTTAAAAATTHPVSTQPHPSTSTTFWTTTTSVGHVPTIATSYSGTGARPKTSSPFWRPPPISPPRHRRRLSPPPLFRRRPQRTYRRTRFVRTHVEYSIEMITLNISLQDLLKKFEEVGDTREKG